MSEKRKKGSKPKPKREQQQPAELPPSVDSKKVGRGRPSKYDVAYCDRVVELGRQGKSRAQIAAAIGVSRNTLDNWAEQHPEFLSAIKDAHDLALAWWEEAGQLGMQRRDFNASMFIFQVVNRFRGDYRRDAGAAEVPVNKEGLIQSQPVATVLVQEDRLAPMFERFYGGLKTIEHQPSKPASGNGHGNGATNRRGNED